MAFLSICLFFVAAFGAPYYQRQLSGSTQQLMAVHTSFKANQARNMKLQDVLSCGAAWSAVLDFQTNSTCAQYVGDNSPLWDNTTADSVVDNYCDATNGPNCADRYAALLSNVRVECAGANYTDDIRNYQVLIKIPCLRDSNQNLCFKTFRHIPDVTSQNLTTAGLDSICVPCTAIILNEMKKVAPVDFINLWAFIDLACYKLNGDYCMTKFQDFINIEEAKPDGSDDLPTAQELDALCNPCIQTVLFRLASLHSLLNVSDSDTQDIINSLGMSAFACQKDFNNNYCFPQFGTFDYTKLDSCNVTLKNPSSCPGSQCQAGLQSFRSQLGCCLGVWFDFEAFMYQVDPTSYDLPAPPALIKAAVEGPCKVNVPDSCAKQKIVIAFVVAGLDPAWAAANQQQLLAIIKVAAAYQLAIDASKITASVGTKTTQGTHHLFANDGTVPVTLTVDTGSDAQTSMGVSNTQNFELSILSSKLPSAALADPSAGVTTQQAQISTVGTGNGAATLSSSSLLLVALVAAAIGMF